MNGGEPSHASRALSRDMPALARYQQGKWGYILAWLVGIPVPILIVIFLLRGCTYVDDVLNRGRRRASSSP